MGTLASELQLLPPPTCDDCAPVHDDLDKAFLRDDDRAPWCRLARVLYDGGHVSPLAEGERPLRRWLRPAYASGWVQRSEVPDAAAMILRNSSVLYLMRRWKDFNPNARHIGATQVRHLYRLIDLREIVSTALGPPRANPRVDLLLAGGIVNPFAPTLTALVVDGEFSPGPELSVVLLPFSQSANEVGVVEVGETWIPPRYRRTQQLRGGGDVHVREACPGE